MKKSIKNRPEPRKTIYCGKCGCKMLENMVGAENAYEYFMGDRMRLYSEYDTKTGKRQYVFRYDCPFSKWYNNHDSIIEDELVTI